MTQKIEVEYDLLNVLEIVEGYSKAGKQFGPVLGVKQSERWNSFVIAIAKKQGIPVRQVNMPKTDE
jgi:hypothetical protein